MMTSRGAAGRLEELARTDQVLAPLATLRAITLDASAERAWRDGVPPFASADGAVDAPVLHGQSLGVDPNRARRLLARLSGAAARAGGAGAAPVAAARTGADPLRLLAAGLSHDAASITTAAADLRVEPALLELLAHLLAVPLLQACRATAAARLADAPWDVGYCPLCGAWPVLAESRGLARERWLRCGGCGAGWRFAHHRCPFCGDDERAGREYLAAPAERESRRAEVCGRCRGYLKSVATFAELGPADLAAEDMTTVELDLAALAAGFSRPTTPGFPLRVRVEPLPRSTPSLWVRMRWPTT